MELGSENRPYIKPTLRNVTNEPIGKMVIVFEKRERELLRKISEALAHVSNNAIAPLVGYSEMLTSIEGLPVQVQDLGNDLHEFALDANNRLQRFREALAQGSPVFITRSGLVELDIDVTLANNKPTDKI